MPLVIENERGAICQSVIQVCSKWRTMPMSVRAPPLAQFWRMTSGWRSVSRSYMPYSAS